MAGKRPLSRLPLDAALVQRLQAAGVASCRDVLVRTDYELMLAGDVNLTEARSLRSAVARAVAPPPVKLQELLSEGLTRFRPTSFDGLDRYLGGGLAAGSITEVVGPSGCGKTQFCLTQAVETVARMWASGATVAYIDTEGAFSAERLMEVASARHAELAARAEFAERVLVFSEPNSALLLQRLAGLERLVIDHKVALVVIDSVAAPVRREFDRDELVARTGLLTKAASLLKNLAAFFALPVLVTNQVTSKYAPHGDALVSQHEATVVAALGNTWSHSVNTRLVVEFAAAERRLRIAKSPIAPPAAFFYRIDASGFCLLAEDRDWANADPNAAAPITSRAAAMLAGDEEHVFSKGDLVQHGDDDDDDAWLFDAELSLGSGEWA